MKQIEKTSIMHTLCTKINGELQRSGYFLSEEDIKCLSKSQIEACKLHQMIDFDSHILFDLANMMYASFLSIFDKDIQQYVAGYEQLLLNKIVMALEEDTLDQLIIHETCRDEIKVNIHAFNEPEHFFTLLHDLQQCDAQKRIEAIFHAEIGFYDYIDLFEMQILSKDEYFLLFQVFDPMSLAYLFYIHFEEACVFHQRIVLDDTLYQKVSITQDWEEVFIQYIITCDRKGAIKDCLLSLQEGIVHK